jgi:ParB family chromosome partitioning protein
LPEARAVALAREAADKGWSVRELEEAVRRSPVSATAKKTGSPGARDPNIAALERELAEKLAARVNVAHARNGRGKVVIHYHSLDELEGILAHLR